MPEIEEKPTQDDVPRPPWVPVTLGALDIIKAAYWPLLILMIYVSLHQPIRSLLIELPRVLGRADVITIGEFNVKLTKALDAKAPDDVRNAIHQMGTAEVRRLLEISNNIGIDCPGRETIETDRLLATRGVFVISDKEQAAGCLTVRATDLGKRVQEFLIALLIDGLNPS
jgi:hypothetical protein